jgi:serine phosphatase RsbU (regulator of sigma subunit)
LAEVNDRLAGRLHGGFATALALRLDASGKCTIACAGHLPPIVNDRELELPGTLPLGIAAEASYEETELQLNPADRLALYTDGLLEARSATGELYGFDRLRTLFAAAPNADQAMEAAVAFGQDDDITVLTLTRLGVEETSTAQFAEPAVSLGQ